MQGIKTFFLSNFELIQSCTEPHRVRFYVYMCVYVCVMCLPNLPNPNSYFHQGVADNVPSICGSLRELALFGQHIVLFLCFLCAGPARESVRRHLVIANIDHVMEPLRPQMPHVISVPGLFVRDPKPVADEKQREFVDSATDGVIVSCIKFEMGSFGGKTVTWLKVSLCSIGAQRRPNPRGKYTCLERNTSHMFKCQRWDDTLPRGSASPLTKPGSSPEFWKALCKFTGDVPWNVGWVSWKRDRRRHCRSLQFSASKGKMLWVECKERQKLRSPSATL